MQIWKARYRDEKHDVYTDIVNTQDDYSKDPLRLTVDGITFVGTSIDDLHPADGTDIEKASERFNILTAGGFRMSDTDVPVWHMLQRYSLDVDIPVAAVRKSDNREIPANIHISFAYIEHDPEKPQSVWQYGNERVYHDDADVREFSLSVDGRKYISARKTTDFETVLTDISRQMSEYYLRCCFTCQYSDYSPYGNDCFGTMQCFIRQKENYLKVNGKSDYFSYLSDKPEDYDLKQEIYLCEKYEIRNRCGGYRGYVDGIYGE